MVWCLVNTGTTLPLPYYYCSFDVEFLHTFFTTGIPRPETSVCFNAGRIQTSFRCACFLRNAATLVLIWLHICVYVS
jgi:hypothetical protein